MARPTLGRPTDAELAILRILWEQGPRTVREVHDHLARTRPPGYARPAGYTSVLKVMQIMAEKGLVARDQSNRSHVYRAAAPREQTLTHLAGDLLERAFGGSARAMILHALSANRSSPEELAQIRQLIEQFQAAQPAGANPAANSKKGGKP